MNRLRQLQEYVELWYKQRGAHRTTLIRVRINIIQSTNVITMTQRQETLVKENTFRLMHQVCRG